MGNQSCSLTCFKYSALICLREAVDLIEALQDTLEEYRRDSSFDELWPETAKRCDAAVKIVQKRLQRGGSAAGTSKCK